MRIRIYVHTYICICMCVPPLSELMVKAGQAKHVEQARRLIRTRYPPEVELMANRKSISRKCHFFEVAFVWDSTKETIPLPLGCLQGGRGTSLIRNCPPP